MAIRTFRIPLPRDGQAVPTVAWLEASLHQELAPTDQLLRWAIVAADATHWYCEGAIIVTAPS